MSTGESIYWPSDNKKIPHLLDIGIMKSIPKDYCRTIEFYFELFSDHSSIIITVNSKVFKANFAHSTTLKQTDPTFRSYFLLFLTILSP